MEDNAKVLMTVCWDAKTGEELLEAVFERNTASGVLRFSHEVSLVLRADLSFHSASSIDCGEASRYRTEAEFNVAWPGVLDGIRKAAEANLLYVRRFRWDAQRSMNTPYEELYNH